MGLFGDGKFKPTPLNVMDVTTCSDCKCLMMNGWAHKLEITTVVQNSTAHNSKSYCQRCKPPYDEKVEYYDYVPEFSRGPTKVMYYKKVSSPVLRKECTMEGVEIVRDTDGGNVHEVPPLISTE